MEKRYIAAFDQGTTSSRTIIFDKRGRVVSKAHVEFPQIYPKAGWVEHDCEDIFSSQLESFRLALEKGGVSPKRSPPSASPTSAKRSSCGTDTRASPSTTQSYGSAAGLRWNAKN